uniref:HPt domain-containing protein n=1 Tax=uncultured bacterium contig00061 TaxID=1181544 RepID=A0A806KCF9_9BACT|nr:hypothetical protein [uncultured bacterium contig00061]
MDIKTQLFKIEELDAAKLLTGKPDEEFDKYVQKLHAFIDSFPDREAELHAALEKQDTAATVKLVEGARDLLVNIAAGALASECTKKLENLANEQFAKISEYVDSLITSLKTLSLDIQMALADKQEQAAEHAQAADESSDKPISEKQLWWWTTIRIAWI